MVLKYSVRAVPLIVVLAACRPENNTAGRPLQPTLDGSVDAGAAAPDAQSESEASSSSRSDAGLGPRAPLTHGDAMASSLNPDAASVSSSADATPPSSGADASLCESKFDDFDRDGFTVADGDCNDCDALVNPGAMDISGNDVDDDCSGTVDEMTACDDIAPDVAETDPLVAMGSLGLCRKTIVDGVSWGVISAKYTLADGTGEPSPLSHGLLDELGEHVRPRVGASMLALSSGTARSPTDPNWQSPSNGDMGVEGHAPEGVPPTIAACPDITVESEVFDPIALEVQLRVPTNANSFSFDFNFHTFEFPEYVCNDYGDAFFALLRTGEDPAFRSLIWDASGSPVGPHSWPLLQVCKPQLIEPFGRQTELNYECARGPEELAGTGFVDPDFDAHGATGWWQTVAPVTPGSVITLRFAIWDAADPILDSLVLLDNFQFLPGSVVGSVTQIVDNPQETTSIH